MDVNCINVNVKFYYHVSKSGIRLLTMWDDDPKADQQSRMQNNKYSEFTLTLYLEINLKHSYCKQKKKIHF